MLALRLFHGRRSPDEVLTDWGEDGPVLGPIQSVHLTYGGIRLGLSGDETIELTMNEGLLQHDRMFYGDAELFEVEHAIEIPSSALAEYRRRVQVFTDSIRELAGDEAAVAVAHALTKLPGRPLSHSPRAQRRTRRVASRFGDSR